MAFLATSFDVPKFSVLIFTADGKSAVNPSLAFCLFRRLNAFLMAEFS
jgi:hypothetical protein